MEKSSIRVRLCNEGRVNYALKENNFEHYNTRRETGGSARLADSNFMRETRVQIPPKEKQIFYFKIL